MQNMKEEIFIETEKAALFGRHCTSKSFFSALHEMPARTSDEKGVCLSFRPSVKRVRCDKTEERSVQVFVPYEDHLA